MITSFNQFVNEELSYQQQRQKDEIAMKVCAALHKNYPNATCIEDCETFADDIEFYVREQLAISQISANDEMVQSILDMLRYGAFESYLSTKR